MGQLTMFALVVLLSCLRLSSSGAIDPSFDTIYKGHFSYGTLANVVAGKEHIYKYSAVVAAGQDEPQSVVSKFQMEAELAQQSHSDGSSFDFRHVQHASYHGPNDGQTNKFNQFEDYGKPFLVEYNKEKLNRQNYKILNKIKVHEDESEWHRNMKRAVASLVLLPIFSRQFLKESSITGRFLEETIYGQCEIHYHVYPKEGGKQDFIMRRTFDPRSCNEYHRQIFFNNDNMKCHIETEEDLVTVSEKIYEYEYINDDEILVKKITSHEKLSYLPWSHKSFGIQYVETNQTIEFVKIADAHSNILNLNKFEDIPWTTNILFNINHYTDGINSEKVQYNNHYTDKQIKDNEFEVKKKLEIVTNYLINNDILENIPKYDDLSELDDLLHSMQILNSASLENIYLDIKSGEEKSEHTVLSRKIFLKLIPHMGTFAAWNFTLNHWDVPEEEPEEKRIKDAELENMLINLPMFVMNPTLEFVKHVSRSIADLDKENRRTSVYDAAVLGYSILLDKTYKNIVMSNKKDKHFEDFLIQELKEFKKQVTSQNRYQQKIMYMLAMGNIQHEKVLHYLRPLILDHDFFDVIVDIEKPEKYRMAAMWAVSKSVKHNKDLIYNIYWPIFSNQSLSQAMRLTAYEFLVPRNQELDIELLSNVHTFVEHEKDDHIFNYHYTTLKSMSESSDPCQIRISEITRQILRLTKKRKIMGGTLASTATTFDYYDSKYGHGMTVKSALAVDEDSGFPHVGLFETILSFARRPRQESAFYWNVDGINLKSILDIYETAVNSESDMKDLKIIDAKVKKLLLQTMGHQKLGKHIHVEYRLMDKGYFTKVKVFFEASLTELVKKYISMYKIQNILDLKKNDIKDKFDFDYLNIDFPNHYQMQVLTDLGIPGNFYNEVPIMRYIKFRPNIHRFKTVIKMKLEFEVKVYHLSQYGMTFFNTFSKDTHSVNRKVVSHFVWPIDLDASFDFQHGSFKVLFPREKITKFSSGGFKITSKDFVKIDSIPEIYIAGNDSKNKINYENVVQLPETELELYHKTSGCNPDRTINYHIDEWIRVLKSMRAPTDTDSLDQLIMIMRQAWTNFLNAPHQSCCQSVWRISPTRSNQTSNIEINLEFSRNKKNHLLQAKNKSDDNKDALEKQENSVVFYIRGSMNKKEKRTNETESSGVIVTLFQVSEHYRKFEMHFKRTSGENNLNICLQAEKSYPDLESISGVDEVATHSSLLFSYNDGNECTGTNSSSVLINLKGELSDEQKNLLNKNILSGFPCFKNPSKPFAFETTREYDWNCLYEAVKFTTLRKYTMTTKFHQIPDETLTRLSYLANYLRYDSLPYIKYKPEHDVEPRTVKVIASYGLESNLLNITAVNPYYTEVLENANYGSDDFENRRNDIVLDNVLFESKFLKSFYYGDIRPCVAHSDEVITDLNQTVSMKFKDWTLMYGDHQLLTYAIFIKTLDDEKLAVKMFFGKHDLTIIPSNDTVPLNISLDGVTQLDSSKWSEVQTEFKLKMVDKQSLVLDLKDEIKVIYYNPYNVVFLPHVTTNNVDGVCGHHGLTSYTQTVPLIYV